MNPYQQNLANQWKHKSTYAVCKMLSATANYIDLRREGQAEPCWVVCLRDSEYTWWFFFESCILDTSIFTRWNSSDTDSIPHLKVLLSFHATPDFPISEVKHPSKEILHIVRKTLSIASTDYSYAHHKNRVLQHKFTM